VSRGIAPIGGVTPTIG